VRPYTHLADIAPMERQESESGRPALAQSRGYFLLCVFVVSPCCGRTQCAPTLTFQTSLRRNDSFQLSAF